MPFFVSLSVREVMPSLIMSSSICQRQDSFKCVIIRHLSLISLTLSFFPLSPSTILCPCRTATSRRRLTMRSGCATGPASCWPPAPREIRHWRRRRACRPVALASWPTCRSCRGWRRPRSCRRSRGGRRMQGPWTTDSRAKGKWPSQARKALSGCLDVCLVGRNLYLWEGNIESCDPFSVMIQWRAPLLRPQLRSASSLSIGGCLILSLLAEVNGMTCRCCPLQYERGQSDEWLWSYSVCIAERFTPGSETTGFSLKLFLFGLFLEHDETVGNKY